MEKYIVRIYRDLASDPNNCVELTYRSKTDFMRNRTTLGIQYHKSINAFSVKYSKK